MGERLDPALDRRQAGERQKPGSDSGDRRQHVEELLGQGRVLGQQEPEAVAIVQLEQQNPRPPARHAARSGPRHRVPRPDEPRFFDAGEVHRHPQQAGLRVVVQPYVGPDELSVSAGHSRQRRPRTGRHAEHGELRRAAARGKSECAHAVRQHRLVQRRRTGRRSFLEGRRSVRAPVLRRSLRRPEQHVSALYQRPADAGA